VRPMSRRLPLLRAILAITGLIQLGMGLTEILAPGALPSFFGGGPGRDLGYLPALGGARYLAMAWGMALAARDPWRHRAWIQVMIFVQAVDWAAGAYYWASEAIDWGPAVALPLLWVVLLVLLYPRQGRAEAEGA